VKITIIFEAEPHDDGEYRQLDGKSLTMDGAENLHLSTVVDIVDDGEGGKLPLDTGSLLLRAHGKRAMWAAPTLKS
jgi:hypothetical protein